MDQADGLIPILSAAIDRARDCRGEPPERETLQFWRELLNEAQEARLRCSRFEADQMRELDTLIAALDSELDRMPPPAVPNGLLRISLD